METIKGRNAGRQQNLWLQAAGEIDKVTTIGIATNRPYAHMLFP